MNVTNENPPASQVFVTATLASAATPAPAPSSIPASPAPSAHPIEGITTTQLNVRSEPSTAGENLGTIAPFSSVQILGKESFAAWYQIVYSNSPGGNGWITASYVQVEAVTDIPVVEAGAGEGPAVRGLVLGPVNVRSGPGTGFESQGSLSPNDVVRITGKDSSGAWMEIDFKGGAGWVTSEFMKVEGLEAVPVTADSTAVSPPGPTPQAGLEEPAFIPAWSDGDSLQVPSASVNLSLSGTRVFEFAGEISSPQGDGEDWVQFTSESKSIRIRLDCSSRDARLDLWKAGNPADSLQCDEDRNIEVQPGDTYSGQLHIIDPGSSKFVAYHLKVGILP